MQAYSHNSIMHLRRSCMPQDQRADLHSGGGLTGAPCAGDGKLRLRLRMELQLRETPASTYDQPQQQQSWFRAAGCRLPCCSPEPDESQILQSRMSTGMAVMFASYTAASADVTSHMQALTVRLLPLL